MAAPSFITLGGLWTLWREETVHRETTNPVSYIFPEWSLCLFPHHNTGWNYEISWNNQIIEVSTPLPRADYMKQLVHWVTDDGRKAALWGHSPILLSSLTGQCLPVYPDRVFIYPFFSAREALHNESWTVLQWGRCGWTPLNPLMFGHRTVCPFMARWNERQLCARARRASSVWEPRPVPKFPTVALDTVAWGWEACERPLSPRDSVEGGHGQLAFGPAKERKGTVRSWTRCGSTQQTSQAPQLPLNTAAVVWQVCVILALQQYIGKLWWHDAGWVDMWLLGVGETEREAWKLFATMT